MSELTTDERAAWCDWYTIWHQDMDGLPALPGDVRDGVVTQGAYAGGVVDGHFICIQDIAVEHCRANLAISECQAPLDTIERCVRGLFDGHNLPLETCIDLLALDTCATTIVQRDADQSCAVPVE